MLLVDSGNTFTISITYKEDGSLQILKDGEPDGKTDTFTFRRPNWGDIRTMNSYAVLVDAVSGKAIIDPYKYMDIKIKMLLVGWTLKQGEEDLPLSADNVNRLDPILFQSLFEKLEHKINPPASDEIHPD